MTPTASLPMYNLPEMRAVNARFWAALHGLLVEAGLRNLPESLTFDRLPVPERIGPEVLFSQTCGYPLETIFSGQAIRLGTPCYDVPGCDGPTHCGLFIVPAGSTARELRDLRGGVFLFNSRHSNSGMNLPRRALADIADGHPFFARVIETGSHPGNLDRIARGEADATVVDNVTFAFWRQHRSEAAQHVRVLAPTPPSPAIPFVTSVATPSETVQILRAALRILVHDARYKTVRDGLLLTDIVDLPNTAYRGLLDYELEAGDLGYPALA
ncbi:MAG TPA: PhnD/SsuA/transferrin family substrate-binding protein [Stellaceae bacterium]